MSDAEILNRFIKLVLSLFDVDIESGLIRYKTENKKRKESEIAGSLSGAGYVRIKILRQDFYAHRLIWLIANNCWPTELDHIDNDKTNNSIKNLREITHAENHQNKKLQNNNRSGIAGVSELKDKRLWLARIKVMGKTIHLGKFKTIEAATKARFAAEELLHPFRNRK